jgi:hypothetical protein
MCAEAATLRGQNVFDRTHSGTIEGIGYQHVKNAFWNAFQKHERMPGDLAPLVQKHGPTHCRRSGSARRKVH